MHTAVEDEIAIDHIIVIYHIYRILRTCSFYILRHRRRGYIVESHTCTTIDEIDIVFDSRPSKARDEELVEEVELVFAHLVISAPNDTVGLDVKTKDLVGHIAELGETVLVAQGEEEPAIGIAKINHTAIGEDIAEHALAGGNLFVVIEDEDGARFGDVIVLFVEDGVVAKVGLFEERDLKPSHLIRRGETCVTEPYSREDTSLDLISTGNAEVFLVDHRYLDVVITLSDLLERPVVVFDKMLGGGNGKGKEGEKERKRFHEWK
jgi:hypothetical protein